ncbi:hypothetical protein TrLO_g4850 [Triparma laevis f. longispina]|uniref:Uncharacterized protein n=1 Tax=Triparma laevis f. longispina TaxID=1714387 RepID=A0A9W7FQA0_9STRA|nr:hypothetical protein TrLO_g4850 [Triparma laevis f. longispina]
MPCPFTTEWSSTCVSGAKELNGKIGYVKKATQERAAVILNGAKGEKAVKPHCLKLIEEDWLSKQILTPVMSQDVVPSEIHEGIDSSITRINPKNKYITAVRFNPNLKRAGPCAFSNADRLLHVEVPVGVEIIGKSAFAHCKNLRSCELPATPFQILDGCFRFCGALRTMTLRHTKEGGRIKKNKKKKKKKKGTLSVGGSGNDDNEEEAEEGGVREAGFFSMEEVKASGMSLTMKEAMGALSLEASDRAFAEKLQAEEGIFDLTGGGVGHGFNADG